jgi:hypothetical protein
MENVIITVVGNLHLYEYFGSVWVLLGPLHESFAYQDSGEISGATDGEVRTDFELQPV